MTSENLNFWGLPNGAWVLPDAEGSRIEVVPYVHQACVPAFEPRIFIFKETSSYSCSHVENPAAPGQQIILWIIPNSSEP